MPPGLGGRPIPLGWGIATGSGGMGPGPLPMGMGKPGDQPVGDSDCGDLLARYGWCGSGNAVLSKGWICEFAAVTPDPDPDPDPGPGGPDGPPTGVGERRYGRPSERRYPDGYPEWRNRGDWLPGEQPLEDEDLPQNRPAPVDARSDTAEAPPLSPEDAARALDIYKRTGVIIDEIDPIALLMLMHEHSDDE